MQRRMTIAALMVAAVAAAAAGGDSVAAADNPNFAGRWTLSRALSQFPRDVGFGVLIPPGLGAGEFDSGAAAALMPRNESETEARNVRQLVDEVRTPSPHLTIVQSDTGISITDDQGQSRRLRPDGKDDFLPFNGSPVATMTRWEGAYLVVRYKVAKDREVRYTYSRKLDPPQLIVQVQFVERGDRDVITRVYEPFRDEESPTPAGATAPGAIPARVPQNPPSDLRGASRAYDPGRVGLPPPLNPPTRQCPRYRERHSLRSARRSRMPNSRASRGSA
jgi:hypothetical protein